MSNSDSPRAQPLTARQLAELIGVSQSTISRAFSHGTSVSPKTRAYVLESAKRLGYRPNAIASFLSRRSSNIVGLASADLSSPVYIELLDKLSKRMQQSNIHPLLFNLPAGADAGDHLEVLGQYHIEAVIVISGRISHATVAKWAADGRTVILMNRDLPDANIGSVRCDNAATALVADHFYDLGLRRVAFIGGPVNTPVSAERETAFVRRVAELGMTLCAHGGGQEYTHRAGFDTALAVMEHEPDAILFANDRLAIGGLDALRWSGGLRVPGDVSIAGFDDIDMASWQGIQLTTLRQDTSAMVDAAMTLLKNALNGSATANKYVIPSELVIRETTGRSSRSR